MSKKVNDTIIKVSSSKEEKQKNREARNKKRTEALAAKTKAREEAKEKGLPWNDTIPAARFLEDYDGAFMSAIAGAPKVNEIPVLPEHNVVAGVNQDPAADITPQEEKTPAQLTIEAAKQAMLGASNDNTEEPEALVGTDLPVATVPAPVQETDDPSTWLVDTNGGLVRLPGESNKRYSNRKHKFKLWKREQTTIEETRNGEPPVEEFGKMYPTGELVYHSDHDKQSLPAPEKSAKESAEVFETVKTDEPTDTTSTEEPAKEDTPQETATSENEVAVVETPPVVEQTTTTEQVQRPTLTLASSQNEKPEIIEAAKKFYGATWTDERAEKLAKAYKFLEMAIRLQQKGESESRINMPMTSAIRLETEALGGSISVAKAA